MERKKLVIGWIGVSITIFFSSLWAYWGTFENFHEGWYAVSIWENLFMLIFQYLLFTILFVTLALVTLKWKKTGLIIHILLGSFCIWFFSGATFNVLGLLIVIPFAVLGLLYFYGEPVPQKWAVRFIILIPLTIIISISIPQIVRISQRINDQNFDMRIIEGKNITLIWSPKGPGWSDRGVAWEEAQQICKYLSDDGLTIMEEEQNIWRLPTVDEFVRSMMLHGENAGGVWLEEEEKATYDKTPDKETPLWDVNAKVIYYWTAVSTGLNDDQAYIMVYNGNVFKRNKINRQSYLSFRAVKEP